MLRLISTARTPIHPARECAGGWDGQSGAPSAQAEYIRYDIKADLEAGLCLAGWNWKSPMKCVTMEDLDYLTTLDSWLNFPTIWISVSFTVEP